MLSHVRSVFAGACIAILLAGCGGGGGDNSNAVVVSTDVFQLKAAYIKATTTTSSNPFTMKGTVNGLAVTGSGTLTDGGLSAATFEGSSAQKSVSSISFTINVNGQNIPSSATSTSYYSATFALLGTDGSQYSVVNGDFNMPVTAKVNDTGIVYTSKIYSSSLKSAVTGTEKVIFALTPETAHTALLKIVNEERDLAGAVVSTDTVTIRITPTGDSTRISETLTDASGNLQITY